MVDGWDGGRGDEGFWPVHWIGVHYAELEVHLHKRDNNLGNYLCCCSVDVGSGPGVSHAFHP